MAKKNTLKIILTIIYTICTFSINGNIDLARQYSFEASTLYVDGNFIEAERLFKKSLELRNSNTPIYNTIFKLRLYSLYNSSREAFCDEIIDLSQSHQSIIQSDSKLLELKEDCL